MFEKRFLDDVVAVQEVALVRLLVEALLTVLASSVIHIITTHYLGLIFFANAAEHC